MIFRKATFVVVLGRDMVLAIQKQLSIKQWHKIVMIPNWADPFIIQPIDYDENPFISYLGLNGKFIVQYSGNMGLIHDMETVVEAARELQMDKRIHFLMIGGGGKLWKIKEMANSYQLQNITFLPYQSRAAPRTNRCPRAAGETCGPRGVTQMPPSVK